jgi:hypothetical protein
MASARNLLGRYETYGYGNNFMKVAQRFTQRDLARVFRAAKQAGVDVQVTIARDGTLSVIPVSGPQEAAQTNEWDKALGHPPAKIR